MIEFSIPGFCMKQKVNYAMLLEYKNNRHIFNDDIVITSCYDSYPCVWNGGRCCFGIFYPNHVEETTKWFNKLGISIRYTFTNGLIKEEHLNDQIGNSILSITSGVQTIKSGINVNSPILKEYIKNKFGDTFYYLTSTTLAKKSIEDINKLSESSIVVPDYSLNNNFEELNKLTNKENIEILVAEACVDNCPVRSNHYKAISKHQLGTTTRKDWICPNKCDKPYDYSILESRHHYVSIDDIRNKYIPIGINKFKISGRLDTDSMLIEKYIRYLIKPEYQLVTREKWLNFVKN